jgi:exodeoxyribonuclease V gamma subunit
MTLRLFTSNRLEILADTLAEVLEKPLASVLDEEIIVVQSKGMERWVSMQLAQRHGICANYRFPFPNAFVHEVFQKVIPDLPERSDFDPKTMTWKIMKLLPSCIRKPGFKSLSAYLGDTQRNVKRFQLSERIADTFDQYLLFRPEMIFQWEGGEENHWQAVLWRELVKETGTMHRAALGKALCKTAEEFPTTLHSLPERISVFGISALPRFHIQMLEALSRLSQINLFLMNPCKEYWGDILSDWEMKKTIARKGTRDCAFEELHLEKGNSLLASMGVLGKDFFDLVNEYDCEEFPLFKKNSGENTLLSWIQSDILNLRDRHRDLNAKEMIARNDTSIQVHSCYSPMREIEVLHDRLLDMFENDSDLLPKDILVMTPDIETYAPYIPAVFDTPTNASRKIPFSIADRSIRQESEIINTFQAILDLLGSRFTASQVFAILESTAVHRKFDIMETDLTLVRKWLTDTRIRWGINREDRGHLGLPALAENTWKAGLERLILGYALPGQDENMFNGILPYDHIEGSDASVLGRLLDFTEQLFTHVTSLGQPRSLNQWSKTLTELCEKFFMPDEDTEREMQVIRRRLNDLGDIQKIAGFDEAIDINVIKWHLKNVLETEGFGFGFITGGVTFCAMLPMRSIPFKVICCVGMNSDAYPRQAKPLGFDLIAKHPRPGDRSRRNDDRYLFLEAILSARKILYTSFIGQNIQDNSSIPPSVVVSELMDYIEQGFTLSEKTILDHIFTKHRLQAFSPEYFKEGKKLFSYSEENCQAAQCILEAREAPISFISMGLSNPEEEWKTVDLNDLSTFFANPSRFLLNKRLGIHLEERASILEDREAFDVKALEKYLLNQKLLKKKLEGENLNNFFPTVHASGQLPHGTLGECIFEELSQGVKSFVEKSKPYIQETTLEPLDVDLNISGFRLTGRINPIYPKRLLHYRYARVKTKDRLRVWIHHLALNCVMTDTYPRTSMLAGLEPDKRHESVWAAWEYSTVEKSKEILGRLLKEYWAGLMKPLHFFSDTSWMYAHMLLEKNKSEEDALNSARRIWEKTDYNRGECEDPYYQLCFGNTDPLDLEFRRIAEEVFRPFFEHQIAI